MKQELSVKQIWAVGLMLFALFLGAGNIIFPPLLGQQAGENIWVTVFGFLVTGVGLPLMSVIAVGRVGNLQTLASRVHPLFGIIFTIIIYLTIGPFFGIPRTATVTYEVGVLPFLGEAAKESFIPLLLTSIIFFSVTAWLSSNPGKLVDRIGKVITPVLVLVLAIIVGKGLISPLGPITEASESYQTNTFFNGFLEGYLTMDTIGGLVFGIVIISAIKDMGIKDKKTVTAVVSKAAIIATSGLALLYLSLTYLGATSVTKVGLLDNGGAILSASAHLLYGYFGKVILAVAITLACLTTAVGLISSCAHFFSKYIPALSYRSIVFGMSLFSTIIANVGLSSLISISLPILNILYPLAISLIILSFFENYFKRSSVVYTGAILAAGTFSLMDSLASINLGTSAIEGLLASLPLGSQGLGWLVPTIIGAFLGQLATVMFTKQSGTSPIDLDLD
ncbi:MAG: branched-chain amino acid transport system II carrier protein [Bacillus sp. (in: firmicutes)]